MGCCKGCQRVKYNKYSYIFLIDLNVVLIIYKLASSNTDHSKILIKKV